MDLRHVDKDSVEQEMVQLIANSAHRVPLPVFILALCLAVSALEHVPLWLVGAWFALAVGVIATRYFVFRSLPDRRDLTANQQFNRVVMLNLLGGVTYSVTVLAFPVFSDVERAFATIVLTGLATCAVVTTPCKVVGAVAYIGPIMLGMAGAWAAAPRANAGPLVEVILPVLVLLYALILVGLAKEVSRSVVASWTIRLKERELNEQLTSALQVAESASNAKTRFLAAASHDLRQPLHTISTIGSALSLRPLDDRTREMVKFLNNVTDSFAGQLDSLLDISKLDAGIVQADLQPVDLTTLVRQHCTQLGPELEAKHLSLKVDCPDRLFARTDSALFLRVLGNLTHNAIKFTKQGGVTIEVRRLKENIQVSVKDTGSGIPTELQEQVFQEFFQVGNPERDRSKGLGLGLSIVKRLVNLMGIRLHMESKPAEGTRFDLLLPAHFGEVISANTVDAPAAPPENLTVMVVDDESAVRSGLRMLIEELKCRCLEASSTDEAVALAHRTRPDLMLVDFRLKGEDSGLRTIEAVKAIYPDVYAVLVSGDTAPARLREADRAGVRLLHKPLSLESLMRLMAGVTPRLTHTLSPQSEGSEQLVDTV